MLAQTDYAHQMTDQKKQILMGTSMKKVSSVFAETAKLIFVPTNQTFSGQSEIHRALEKDSKLNDLLQEKVTNQFVAKNVVIEEAVVSFNHTDEMTWLLPGVKATRKSATFPMVSIVEFDQEGKILNKRVYWDQASVLKQIGVLPNSLYCRSNASEVTLPISGAEIVNAFDTTAVPKPAPVEERPTTGRMESHDLFNTTQETFRPSSRVLARPGGATHDIFSNEPIAHQTREKRHIPSVSSLNLYDDVATPVVKKDNVRDPNWSNQEDEQVVRESRFAGLTNQSHFQLGAEGEPEQFVSAKKVDPTLNQSHFAFGQEEVTIATRGIGRRDPNAQSESLESRPSSRVLNVPGGKQSFSFDEAPLPTQSNKRDPNARSQEHSAVRPSSRVLSVPGGSSSISLA